MKRRHACLKLSGVLCSPNPYTSTPCSRMRAARRVKSLSDKAEAVETSAVQQVHGIDHQGDIGCVLPCRVGELLMGNDGEPSENICPGLQALAGEVTVDA